MELKHQKTYYIQVVVYLLIVPYGIETPASQASRLLQELLIVPYGIETIYTNIR